MIRLVTFAHDAESIAHACELGADHLVIDDPRLSVRCWLPVSAAPWSRLDQLAAAARFARPEIRLSLNVDLLCRDESLPLIDEAVRAAAAAGFDAVRLQDAGLARVVREAAPRLALELATEMGNCCCASVAAHAAEGFTHQVLSNDWPLPDLRTLHAAPPCSTELLVHGPVLLQYSDRRQISAGLVARGRTAHADPGRLPATGWRQVVVEGRRYPFADNPHGSFMYNTFDRSLLPQAEQLLGLPLTAWLIDGRGQRPAYLATALRGFAALRDGAGPEQVEALWQAMQAAGERRFKPGFFLANNTDRCFDDQADDHAQHETVAEVIDVIRGEAMTLLLRQDLPADPEDLRLRTPEGREQAVDYGRMTDVRGRRIDQAVAGSVIRLPWVKGAVPASTLRRPAN